MGYPFHRHPYTVLLVVRTNGLHVWRWRGPVDKTVENWSLQDPQSKTAISSEAVTISGPFMLVPEKME